MNAKQKDSGTADKDKLTQSPQSGDGQKQGGTDEQHSNPGPHRELSADEDMDDDTGLSNRVNRQSEKTEQENKQSHQSNVGRRDDGTPD